ncbi:MAG: relaxase domain-containing protein, partial [Acidimicrobiales bacterium]
GVTVSMRVMSAGDGYKCLLQSVAAGDGHRPLTTPLIAYYTEKGAPPGYWLGTGVHGLGTNDQRIEPGGTVTEDHLRRLLGQGRDPLTDDPLGLPYFRHQTVEERVATRVERLPRT